MLPLYNPRAPSFLTVWINTSMGPFCVIRSAPHREKVGEGVQTYPLRWNAAYNQPLLDIKFDRHSRGAIWALVFMVSSGCPTRTCAAPPALPAMSSFTVLRSAMTEGGEWLLRKKRGIGQTSSAAVGHHSTEMASTSLALIDDSHQLRGLRFSSGFFPHTIDRGDPLQSFKILPRRQNWNLTSNACGRADKYTNCNNTSAAMGDGTAC